MLVLTDMQTESFLNADLLPSLYTLVQQPYITTYCANCLRVNVERLVQQMQPFFNCLARCFNLCVNIDCKYRVERRRQSYAKGRG